MSLVLCGRWNNWWHKNSGRAASICQQGDWWSACHRHCHNRRYCCLHYHCYYHYHYYCYCYWWCCLRATKKGCCTGQQHCKHQQSLSEKKQSNTTEDDNQLFNSWLSSKIQKNSVKIDLMQTQIEKNIAKKELIDLLKYKTSPEIQTLSYPSSVLNSVVFDAEN